MMKRVFVITVLTMAALMVASGLSAQHHDKQVPRKGDKKAMMMEKKSGMQGQRNMCAHGMMCMQSGMLRHALGINQDQAVKIDEINLNYRKKILEYSEKIAPRNIALQRSLLEDSVDMARVRAAVKEIADLKVEVRMLKIQKRADIEKVLTPEQRTRFRTMHTGGCGRKCPMMGGKAANQSK